MASAAPAPTLVVAPRVDRKCVFTVAVSLVVVFPRSLLINRLSSVTNVRKCPLRLVRLVLIDVAEMFTRIPLTLMLPGPTEVLRQQIEGLPPVVLSIPLSVCLFRFPLSNVPPTGPLWPRQCARRRLAVLLQIMNSMPGPCRVWWVNLERAGMLSLYTVCGVIEVSSRVTLPVELPRLPLSAVCSRDRLLPRCVDRFVARCRWAPADRSLRSDAILCLVRLSLLESPRSLVLRCIFRLVLNVAIAS